MRTSSVNISACWILKKKNCVSDMREKKINICPNGHRYYKSSDCPVCPVCENERKLTDGFLAALSAPARRALEREQIDNLKALASRTEKEILKLHGIGPASLPILKAAL